MANMGGGGGGNASGIRAGRAFVELGTNDKGLFAGLDRAAAAVRGFGLKVAGVGGGLVGAGLSVLGPLGAAFKEMVDHFSEINDAADRMSTTPEIVSALGYAAEQSGAQLEDLEGATKNLYKSIAASGRPASDLIEEYRNLANELDGIDDPAAKSAKALEVLGKNGLKLLPMLKDGAAGFDKLIGRAARVGDVVSEEDASRADRAGDAMLDVWKSIRNTIRSIPLALLPYIETIEAVTDKIVDLLGAVRGFIKANGAAIVAVTAGATALVALGSAVVGVGAVVAAAGVALAAFSAVGAALLTPAGALVGILAGLAGALAYFALTTEEGRRALAPFVAAFNELWGVFSTTYGGILDALMAGDLELAGEIAMTGLEAAWVAGVNRLHDAWDDFKEFFVSAWESASLLVQLAFNDVTAYFTKAWLKAFKLVNDRFHETFRTMAMVAAKFADAAGDAAFANTLRQFAALTKGQMNLVLGGAGKIVENKRQAEEDRLHKAFADAAEARAGETAAERAEREKRLAEAKGKLDQLAADAAVGAILSGLGGDKKKTLSDVVNPGLSRGTFATRGFGAQAFGDTSMAGRQVKAAEKVPPLLQNIDKKLGDILNLGPLTLGT